MKMVNMMMRMVNMMRRMVKVMKANIRAATVNYDVNKERQELLNGKKKKRQRGSNNCS